MKRLLAILLITHFLAAQLAAQGFSQLAPGDRVRVWTTDIRKRTGEIVAFSVDTLEVRFDGKTDSLAIPRSQLTRLDVSRGRRTRRESARVAASRGSAIGAGTGVMTALLAPDAAGSRGPAAVSGAMAGGFMGLIVGQIVGALRPQEKWERVW